MQMNSCHFIAINSSRYRHASLLNLKGICVFPNTRFTIHLKGKIMKTTHTVCRQTVAILAAATAMTLGACASVPSPQPVAATIAATPELSTLSSLITKSGLANTLNGAGSFTVFAPSNEAFKAVPAKTLEELSANPSRLTEVLTYHVLAGKAMAQDVKSGPAKTVQGGNIALAKAGAFVTVEDAVVQTADINATNGVVHIVDRVLIPPVRK
jgi:uncharacterized surface protein with fasciclin (FAS1) repeats